MKGIEDLPQLQTDFVNTLKQLGLDPVQIPQVIDNFAHSSKTCREIASRLERRLPPDVGRNLSIVLMGSYGRLEASARSDVDYVLLTKKPLSPRIAKSVNRVTQAVIRDFQDENVIIAQDRLFGKVLPGDDLRRNIGGTSDSNDGLTSRMLLLLESVCVYNPSLYRNIYQQLWTEYTSKILEARKAPQLLINEVLRYYRMLCLDYKYKVDVQGKPWGIRNIKLRHSRKLLIFSTMLTILDSVESGDCDFSYLRQSLNNPPLFKLAAVMVRHGLTGPLDPFLRYDSFMRALSDGVARKSLSTVRFYTREKDPLYVTLRKNSYDLQDALIDLLSRLGPTMQKKIYQFFIF
ncbi:MAG: DUF294 nucleotidyltransferase-like domain-containing protein [Thermoplasmata archaeon]